MKSKKSNFSWVIYKRWLNCIVLFIATEGVTRFIHVDLSSYFKIILWAVVASVVILPIFFGVMSLCEPKQAKFAFAFGKRYLYKKLKRKNH